MLGVSLELDNINKPDTMITIQILEDKIRFRLQRAGRTHTIDFTEDELQKKECPQVYLNNAIANILDRLEVGTV